MRRLYRLRRSVTHAIEALAQSLAGEVNKDKLRMLVEPQGDNSVRCGNVILSTTDNLSWMQ